MGIPFPLTFPYTGWGALLMASAQLYLGRAAATFHLEPLSDITIIIASSRVSLEQKKRTFFFFLTEFFG